jgi:hypothetical protein
VGEDQRGSLDLGNHTGRRESLATARNSQQRLVAEAIVDAFNELCNRLGLIARGRVVGFQYEGFLFHALILNI